MRQSDVTSPVYFDDLQVSHTHSPVVQKGAEGIENVRWTFLTKSQVAGGPFGLSFNSYSRAAITDQNFKFNAGSELEKMTDWYSTPFRKYDPSLGRFHGVDALAELNITVGPSSFAHNNPISFNDPTGLDDNDGDEENGGGGGGVPPIPMQGPWYGYDMRGYDNIAKATQGHGGNNGWAVAGRFGSLYNRIFGASSPNFYQHMMAKFNKALSTSEPLTSVTAKGAGIEVHDVTSRTGGIESSAVPLVAVTLNGSLIGIFDPDVIYQPAQNGDQVIDGIWVPNNADEVLPPAVNLFGGDDQALAGLINHFRYVGRGMDNGNYHLSNVAQSMVKPSSGNFFG